MLYLGMLMTAISWSICQCSIGNVSEFSCSLMEIVLVGICGRRIGGQGDTIQDLGGQ